MMIVLERSSSLDNWPERKGKKKKKKKKNEKKKKHKLPTEMVGLDVGVGWGIYINKNTIILVDQLYSSLQIIIHSLPTVK